MNTKGVFRAGWIHNLAVIIVVSLPLAVLRAQVVYSLNAVGYVDVNLVAGSNLVANPLNAATNNIANLFRGLPDGSFFLPWNQGSVAFGPTNHYSAANGWTDPNAIFIAPDGGFLWVPGPKKISFVGEPWAFVRGPLCVTYPQGDSISGWFIQAICGICEFPPCTPWAQGASLLKWDPASQSYHVYTYFFGMWEPSEPIIGPAEAFRVNAPQSFTGMSPFQSTLGGGGTVAHGRSFGSLRELQRNGTNVTFRLAATNGTTYSLLCTTNLRSGVWQIVQQGAADGSGFANISVPMTNRFALYKVHPQYGGPNPFLISRLSARGTASFSFDFYAPSNTSYRIERSITFPAASWQVITNVNATANTLVSVTDANATADSGYYRVSY
jgi:hypothetical protein